MEMLVALERNGTVRGGGVEVGGAAMAFVLDAASHDDAHDVVVRLPSYGHADWVVTPLVAFDRDLEVTREAAQRLGVVT
jgi:muconolactone delta-isomerase